MRSKPFALLLMLCALALIPIPAAATQEEAPVTWGPSLLTGPNDGEPVDIAIAYLRAQAATYGLDGSDVADLAVTSSPRSAHTGVTHVNLNQRFEGLEVFGGHGTVSIAEDGSVVFVGGSLIDGLRAATTEQPESSATEVVEAAAEALDLAEPTGLRVLDGADAASGEALVTDGGISDEPIPARLGWQPTDDGLRLAWQVVIDDSTDSHLWNATIDDATGELLDLVDWTIEDSHEALSSTLARPASTAATSRLAAAALQSSNPAVDGSSYRVFALPKEGPNDGPRTLESNPADATASPFGWHDTDGVAGPEFTTTQGNNVHAYSDRDANNQVDPGSEPEGGPTLTFDFVADLNEHPQTYVDASITNLFFWCNVSHDLGVLYGFDEANGNFQVTNYTGEGVGGDDVRCEGQDGGGQNNANFSTPAADGGRPRMQMFLWPGAQFGRPNAVTIDGGDAAGTYEAEYARFTPAPTTAGFAGPIVLADDGVDAPNDGCTPYAVPAGSIVVVDNGGACNNYTQVATAEAAGAIAVIVADNAGTNPSVMSGSMDPPVGIPAVQVSTAEGALIKAGLPATGSVHRNRNRPPMRDADFRANTIFHEYGHGVSLRLTGGPGVNCLSGNEQMGEGWSDYLAITALMDPTIEDPWGPRGYGQYALFNESRVGPGYRAAPYSKNKNIQPFTYDMIKTGEWINGGSLAIPHGIGNAWASVLWDLNWDMVHKHGFNPDPYQPWDTGGNNLMLQLVFDGLKLQGCGPGFVVGRDAIIAADTALTGGENYCTLWRGFARRGLGFSAVQGTTNRNDNDEAFDLPTICRSNQSRTLELLGENLDDEGDPDGSGQARISWRQDGEVCFDIRLTDVSAVTSAELRSGGHGEDGDLIIDLDVDANGLKGCADGADPADLLEVRAAPTQFYLIIATTEHADGALRAQLN